MVAEGISQWLSPATRYCSVERVLKIYFPISRNSFQVYPYPDAFHQIGCFGNIHTMVERYFNWQIVFGQNRKFITR